MFLGMLFTDSLISESLFIFPEFVAIFDFYRGIIQIKKTFNTKITNQLSNCLFLCFKKIPPSHEKSRLLISAPDSRN